MNLQEKIDAANESGDYKSFDAGYKYGYAAALSSGGSNCIGLEKLLDSLIHQSNGCGDYRGSERYILSGIINYTKELIEEEKQKQSASLVIGDRVKELEKEIDRLNNYKNLLRKVIIRNLNIECDVNELENVLIETDDESQSPKPIESNK